MMIDKNWKSGSNMAGVHFSLSPFAEGREMNSGGRGAKVEVGLPKFVN